MVPTFLPTHNSSRSGRSLFRGFVAAFAIVALAAPAFAQDDEGTTKEELQTLKDKASYAIGFNIGSDVSNEDLGLNMDLVIKGIMDAAAGRDNILSTEELQGVMQAFQKELMEKEQAQREALAQKNLTDGVAYLEQNALKDGVKQLENGIQYKVITEGDGASPTKESNVKVHYKGTLPNGDEFDSSYTRGEPATFNVSGVIRGWTEILPRMKVGAKWQVVIPSGLAYGPQGIGQDIGPNQVLVFEIELLEILE